MTLRWTICIGALFVPVAMAACGGVVAPDDGGGPGPSPTSSPTSTPTSGPTPTPTTTPPPGTCVETSDHFSLSVTGGGHFDSCTSPTFMAHEYDVEGQIVRARPDDLQLDLCGPAADCTPIFFDVVASAPGLDLSSLPIGSFVHVHLAFSRPGACLASIVVTSLDTWEGVKNPVDVGGHLYFAGSDGALDAPGLTFKVGLLPNHCKPMSASCSSVAADDYTLRFDSGVGAAVDVPMGSTSYIMTSEPGNPVAVRNLRSFYSGACDANYDWAFWTVRATPTGL